MNKILVFGDFHLDRNNKFLTEEAQFLMYWGVVNQVAELASKVSFTVFLGDWFNKLAETLPKSVVLEASRMIAKISAVTPTYMIAGNHDLYKEQSLLSTFDSEYSIPVISPVEIGRDVWLLPYGFPIPKEARGILFAHFGISGSQVGSGYLNLDEEVPLSKLTQFGLVMCGHYHTRQILNQNKDQLVMHPGSVMAHSFADTEEDKGVWIVDTDDILDPKFIRIESPKYRTRYIGSKLTIAELIDEASKSMDFYRAIVAEDNLDLHKLPPNVRIEYDIDNKPTEHYTEEERKASLESDVYEFIDKSNTALDKARLTSLAKGILEKV